MNEITLDELAKIKASADGHYKRPAMALIDSFAIDAEVCAEIPCEQCGGAVRCEHVLNGGGYRAFAVCDVCQIAVEF